ncbi:DUF4148 domain-containing protein [Paraburkholderia haematera]|uniref:DUF4148 domain-containing protein n=1 Tax=Paraburkholderia haematera TaxID=2793077 RepID=A0ABM8SV36_9BURK|nr:DUF4148 domain-containing protein [Paraburkholderia haematera]CAE6835483.1 hypothetical protein R69888_06749 [Paraburkholderia haematera]
MRNAIWLAGFALNCACVSAAVAVDTIPLREPAPGPHEFYLSHERILQKPQVLSQRDPVVPGLQPASSVQLTQPAAQLPPAPQGKTRDEVKRELAAARAWGCMDVPDSQYPQPCPSQGVTRSTAEAFQTE